MGLFDRIKKSLFNKKDKDTEEESKNKTSLAESETKIEEGSAEDIQPAKTEIEDTEDIEVPKLTPAIEEETEKASETEASEYEGEASTEEKSEEVTDTSDTLGKVETQSNAQESKKEATSETITAEVEENSPSSEESETSSDKLESAAETNETITTSTEPEIEENTVDTSEDEKNEPEEKEVGEETEEADQEKYDKGLEKTNRTFGERLNAFFAKFRSVDEDFFDDLEDLLIESDVGYETAMQLTDSLRDEAKLQKAKSHDELKQVVVEKLVEIYDQGENNKDSALTYDPDAKPNVYLFVGVNGAGKTTTIGKLAKRLKDSGKSVMMVAGDTFRAGAVEQLVEWGKRDGIEVITGKENADPASVVYDGVSKAKEQGIDYLLVDTAGRLQNKVNLMNELDKIERTIKKILPDQPNEVLLVLDGSTGQNALLQAKDFNKTTELTGLVLTKLDGSSKGGVVIAIRNEMNLPVKLVGLGEKVDDLADFDAEKFAIGLFQGLI